MIHFITFGNTPKYSILAEMLAEEARTSQYFDTVTVFNEKDIPSQYREFIASHSKGYGYWIWKTIFILETMEKYFISPDDIIVYADCACGISVTEAARINFKKWIVDLRNQSPHRIGFQMSHLAETWTKADLFTFLECTDEKYTQTGQHIGTIQLYLNTLENQAFLKEYLLIMTTDNYHYLTDEPSRIPNPASFKEHRHDQAILSLLFKKYGVICYPDHWNSSDFPIMALRRRGNIQW